jgi:hypothetical protein
MPFSPARTRETVLMETPARWAISDWRGRLMSGVSFISSPALAKKSNMMQILQTKKICKNLSSQ